MTRRPRRKCGRRIPSWIPSRERGSGLAGAAGSRDGKSVARRPAAAGLGAQPVLPGAVRAAVTAADRRRQGESRPARLLTGAPPLPLAWLIPGLPTCSPLPGSPNPTARAAASQPRPALPRAQPLTVPGAGSATPPPPPDISLPIPDSTHPELEELSSPGSFELSTLKLRWPTPALHQPAGPNSNHGKSSPS